MESIMCAGPPSHVHLDTLTNLKQHLCWRITEVRTFDPLQFVNARRKFESLQKLEGILFWILPRTIFLMFVRRR